MEDNSNIRSQNVETAEYAKRLLKKLWVTRGIRFESKVRLERKFAASNLAIQILSIYVILVSLIDILIKSISSTNHFVFPLVTIIAPIFILVIGQHESSKGYLVNSEKMNKSAQNIQQLHSELEYLINTDKITYEKLNGIRIKYEEILRDFSQDHARVDYHYFKALHPSSFNFKTRVSKYYAIFRGKLFYFLSIWGFPSLMMSIPGLIIIMGFSNSSL